jgi:hypothetical protein
MKVSNDVEDGVASCVRDHLKPGAFHAEVVKGRLERQGYSNATRKLLKRIAPLSWKVLVSVCEADFRGRVIPGVQEAKYLPGEMMGEMIGREKLDVAPTQPLILGRDVLALIAGRGISRKPGRWVGDAIRSVEARRDAGEIITREQALEVLRTLEL